MLEIKGYKSIELGSQWSKYDFSFEMLMPNPKYELYITEFWYKTYISLGSANCPSAENK